MSRTVASLGRAQRRVCRRGGRAEFVDEPTPRFVVAGVAAEEAFVRAGQLLPAVGLEWFDALVVFAPAAFVFEPLLQIRLAGEPFGQRPGLVVEGGEGGAEHGVQEPDPDRAVRRRAA